MRPLAGHSGCELQFAADRVRKLAHGVAGIRLRRQAEKQRTFSNPHLRAPVVLGEELGDDYYAFTMERVDGGLAFDHSPEPYLGRLLAYIGSSMRAAPVEHVPERTFTAKVAAVVAAVEDNGALGQTRDWLVRVCCDVAASFAGGCCMPCGPCHGDLTFCNLVCTPPPACDVWLVDFLDVFVESPLLDMVKLRQDTHHGWVRLFAEVDPAVLAYADGILHAAFSAHPSYRELYPRLALLNLLRILPYVREERVLQHLLPEVRRAHAALDVRG